VAEALRIDASAVSAWERGREVLAVHEVEDRLAVGIEPLAA
jgi:hypothetical protein